MTDHFIHIDDLHRPYYKERKHEGFWRIYSDRREWVPSFFNPDNNKTGQIPPLIHEEKETPHRER